MIFILYVKCTCTCTGKYDVALLLIWLILLVNHIRGLLFTRNYQTKPWSINNTGVHTRPKQQLFNVLNYKLAAGETLIAST